MHIFFCANSDSLSTKFDEFVRAANGEWLSSLQMKCHATIFSPFALHSFACTKIHFPSLASHHMFYSIRSYCPLCLWCALGLCVCVSSFLSRTGAISVRDNNGRYHLLVENLCLKYHNTPNNRTEQRDKDGK